MTYELSNLDYIDAKTLQKHYIQKAKEFSTKPMLAYLSLAESVFADGETYGKKYKKTDKQKQEDWDKVISDDNNPMTLDKDGYFRLFYPQDPSTAELARGVYDQFFEIINK